MRRLILTAIHVDKNRLSHRAYEREIVLLHLADADFGDGEHSRKTCRYMVLGIAEHGK